MPETFTGWDAVRGRSWAFATKLLTSNSLIANGVFDSPEPMPPVPPVLPVPPPPDIIVPALV